MRKGVEREEKREVATCSNMAREFQTAIDGYLIAKFLIATRTKYLGMAVHFGFTTFAFWTLGN